MEGFEQTKAPSRICRSLNIRVRSKRVGCELAMPLAVGIMADIQDTLPEDSGGVGLLGDRA